MTKSILQSIPMEPAGQLKISYCFQPNILYQFVAKLSCVSLFFSLHSPLRKCTKQPTISTMENLKCIALGKYSRLPTSPQFLGSSPQLVSIQSFQLSQSSNSFFGTIRVVWVVVGFHIVVWIAAPPARLSANKPSILKELYHLNSFWKCFSHVPCIIVSDH